jgi:HEPN domain-containing protein
LPRKTDSNNPADWLFIAGSELEGLRALAQQELAYTMCRSKLAEVVEKIIKAELIRTGWYLEKTHDLEKLLGELAARKCDLTIQFEPVCESLAEIYFMDRYPGFELEDPDWPALRIQVEEVTKLFSSVKARVSGASNS